MKRKIWKLQLIEFTELKSGDLFFIDDKADIVGAISDGLLFAMGNPYVGPELIDTIECAPYPLEKETNEADN